METSKAYSDKMHNLIFNNCHSYIADILNGIEYQGRSNWTQFGVFWLISFKSEYVSFKHVIKTYIWSVIVYSIFVGIVFFLSQI